MIRDSGNRREFESGAVRDMQEGKGRCDLMPLNVVAELLESGDYYGDVFGHLNDFMNDHLVSHLFAAIHHVLKEEDMFDGCYETMFLEVAVHFEEGAKKYGENNWQKGLPINCYIDSAIRHYLKWLRGDKDERHDRAFVWNLMCCAWEVGLKREVVEEKPANNDQTNDAYERGYKAGLLDGVKKAAAAIGADCKVVNLGD